MRTSHQAYWIISGYERYIFPLAPSPEDDDALNRGVALTPVVANPTQPVNLAGQNNPTQYHHPGDMID